MSGNEDLAKAFSRLADDGAATELDAALLVNRTLDPTLDETEVRQAITDLVPPDGVAPWAHLSSLGFRGDDEHYQDLANSCMNAVLARRRGIPITLAVLLLTVARQAGLPAMGLNAPGHFLSRVGHQVIDPFTMAVLPVAGEVAPAGPVDIALRMLNNIKQIRADAKAHAEALTIIDYQLRMVAGRMAKETHALLLLERGEHWRALGVADAAIDAYESAMALGSGQSELVTVCRARVAQLEKSPRPTLH